jgi:hypothetical protein
VTEHVNRAEKSNGRHAVPAKKRFRSDTGESTGSIKIRRRCQSEPVTSIDDDNDFAPANAWQPSSESSFLIILPELPISGAYPVETAQAAGR